MCSSTTCAAVSSRARIARASEIAERSVIAVTAPGPKAGSALRAAGWQHERHDRAHEVRVALGRVAPRVGQQRAPGLLAEAPDRPRRQLHVEILRQLRSADGPADQSLDPCLRAGAVLLDV